MFAQHQWLVSADEKENNAYFWDSATVLLTYQGNWGLVPSDTLQAALPVDVLTSQIKELPRVVELWSLFGLYCQGFANRCEATLYCYTLEVCLKTWQQEGKLRVHGHLYMKKTRVTCDAGRIRR